jgi:hypothetical protein
MAMGAKQAKLDANLRTSSSLSTPSIQCIHDYYAFALEDGGRLAPMAVYLVYLSLGHIGGSSTFVKHGCGGPSFFSV